MANFRIAVWGAWGALVLMGCGADPAPLRGPAEACPLSINFHQINVAISRARRSFPIRVAVEIGGRILLDECLTEQVPYPMIASVSRPSPRDFRVLLRIPQSQSLPHQLSLDLWDRTNCHRSPSRPFFSLRNEPLEFDPVAPNGESCGGYSSASIHKNQN